MKTISALLPRKFRSVLITGIYCAALLSGSAQSSDPVYFFSHFAGPSGGPGRADGVGSAARFNVPDGIVVDRTGNIFVADSANHAIRKITPDGKVSTFAGQPGVAGSADGTGGTARFSTPLGLALDKLGNLYVADSDNATIRKITMDGAVTTLAGIAGLRGSTDGSPALALFWSPRALAFDPAGAIYVADNSTIRKIAIDGTVSTPAGKPGPWGKADGQGPAAMFTYPGGIAVDNAGVVYVADTGSNKIRKITSDGMVTSLTTATGQLIQINAPQGLLVDNAGNLFVTSGYEHRIMKITPGGDISVFAGGGNTTDGRSAGTVDGVGVAAQFWYPRGIAKDLAGNFFVADGLNYEIRKITPDAVVTTFAGKANGYGSSDGVGEAARFYFPYGAAVDGSGNVYVADSSNHTIRKIFSTGSVSTFAGTAGVWGGVDGVGEKALFDVPRGVAVDAAGNVYVADTLNFCIRKITPDRQVTTLAGAPGWYNSGYVDGSGAAARFRYPVGVAVNSAGEIYVADFSTVRKITPDGNVSTLAGVPGYYAYQDGQGPAAKFMSLSCIATDRAGNIYVGDTEAVRKITPGGFVTTLAGTGAAPGYVDDVGTAARFQDIAGLTVDGAGNIFVTEKGNYQSGGAGCTIRKITPDGRVTTVGGVHGVNSSDDGLGAVAGFNLPTGIAADNAGTLFIVEYGNHAVRKGELAAAPKITAQPQNQAVTAGGAVQLSVTASGLPAPTYQWYMNGSPFAGATTSTLSFSNARSSDAGDYTVVVTNALGSVTSTKATITISNGSASPGSGSSSGGGALGAWFALGAFFAGVMRLTLRRK